MAASVGCRRLSEHKCAEHEQEIEHGYKDVAEQCVGWLVWGRGWLRNLLSISFGA